MNTKLTCLAILSALLLSFTAAAETRIDPPVCAPDLKLTAPDDGSMPEVVPPDPMLRPPSVLHSDGTWLLRMPWDTACDMSNRLNTLERYPAIANRVLELHKPDYKWPVIGGFVVGLGTAGLLFYLAK